MCDDALGVVVDLGTQSIKIGDAGADAPKDCVPSICCGELAGHEAFAKIDGNSCTYPLEHGIVSNWNDLERLLKASFDTFGGVEERPILLTEAPLNPKANREKLAEIMFDSFNVPCIYVGMQAVLSCYASGRTTGCVIDSGYAKTHVVPILEGEALPHAIIRLDLAGKDLDEAMQKILVGKGVTHNAKSQLAFASEAKEKLGFVAQDYIAAQGQNNESSVTLSNGKTATLDKERSQIPEIMFQPGMIEMESSGLAETNYNAIMKCDVDHRKLFYANTILCGGNTMFPAMAPRIQHEMAKLAPPTMKIKIIAPPERHISPWIGGSILANLPHFQKMWITKKEFQESGPSIIHRKQF